MVTEQEETIDFSGFAQNYSRTTSPLRADS